MAISHEGVQKAILDICETDKQLAKVDHRTIWRKFFLDGILKMKLGRSQYWVIDALDECKNDSDLIPLLLKASKLSSIRIVITSRNRFESYRQMLPSKTKVILDKIENSIAACCGQLVYVDSRSRVHMIHQTARDFLLQSSTDSEFLIERKAGYKSLAMTCLQYLCRKEMSGPRLRKLSANNFVRTRSAFASYACSCLFEPVINVNSAVDEFFLTLVKFLNSSNVSSWIEYLGRQCELGCLILTGRSFRKYLQRRSKYMVPLGKDVTTLDSWATDLVRLAAKFGKNLTANPSSIFHLIPPFFPSESAPRKQFASSAIRGISVLGLSATSWDDYLSTIVQPGEQLTALTCSDNHFAVGSSNGRVMVYNELTTQEAHTLQHEEPVRTLQFGQTGTVMASASMKVVRIWSITLWQQPWRLDITHECMSLAITDEDQLLLGAQRNNFLMI
jgi:hypothetical protein